VRPRRGAGLANTVPAWPARGGLGLAICVRTVRSGHGVGFQGVGADGLTAATASTVRLTVRRSGVAKPLAGFDFSADADGADDADDVSAPAPAAKRPANHDLVGLYDYAVLYGLKRSALVTKDLPHISELHKIHYARYPQANVKPVAMISQYDDLADELFADVQKTIGP
jgi:hypothetical protein